jgi:hypothetical protein
MTSAVQRYEALAETLLGDPAVTRPERRGFAQGGLMKTGKLFATLRGDQLLLKLPAARVASLIASGQGAPFDANKGKPMKEWVLAETGADWEALAREAADFVTGA